MAAWGALVSEAGDSLAEGEIAIAEGDEVAVCRTAQRLIGNFSLIGRRAGRAERLCLASRGAVNKRAGALLLVERERVARPHGLDSQWLAAYR